MMGIAEKLMKIQCELKAPKNLYNSFGKYKYRNLEGIFEAVKPMLKKHNCMLFVSDDIVVRGDRFYVEATATITDIDDGSLLQSSGMAREATTKKGMDESQLTGTASSYARKYALSGLFLLDDTKDADTDEFHEQTHRKTSGKKAAPADPEPMTEEEIEKLKKKKIGKTKATTFLKELKANGISAAFVCQLYKIEKLSDMTEEMLSNANSHLKDIKAKQEASE